MNAKQARSISHKRQQEVAAALEVIHGKMELQKVKTFQDTVNAELKHWESCIKSAAEDGKDYVSLFPPNNDNDDKVYEACKAALEAKGYRVSTYTTDEGYCIGDVTHVSITW